MSGLGSGRMLNSMRFDSRPLPFQPVSRQETTDQTGQLSALVGDVLALGAGHFAKLWQSAFG